MFVVFYLHIFISLTHGALFPFSSFACIHVCTGMYGLYWLKASSVLWRELISYAVDAARRVRGQARTEGESVTSGRGKGFPFLTQVWVKVHLYAFFSGSNSLMVTHCGTRASLLEWAWPWVCNYGQAGVSSSPNILSSLLLSSTYTSKDIIPF